VLYKVLYIFLMSAVQCLYMVKTDSKRLNVRLRRPVAFALEELAERWGVSQTAALERAILGAHGGGVKVSLPPMVDGQTHYRLEGVGNAVPSEEPGEFKIEYDEG
jgi:hypothetical protein